MGKWTIRICRFCNRSFFSAMKTILTLSVLVLCGLNSQKESDDPAKTVVDRATGAALQADSASAARILMPLQGSQLSQEDAAFRACMLDRFGPAGRAAMPIVADDWARNLGGAYVNYWQRALTNPTHRRQAEKSLNAALSRLTKQRVETNAEIEGAEEKIQEQARQRGLYTQLGTTAPLRDFMLWRTTRVEQREVLLPEGPFSVKVTFLDDFLVRGWGHYATCGRRSTGGWATQEGLYAVVPAYKSLSDETFSVRFLAHETQHFADKRRFRNLQSWELEFRAKLTELVLAQGSQGSTLQRLCENQSQVNDSTHAYANYRVIHDVAQTLGVAADSLCGSSGVRGQSLRDAARNVLSRDSTVRKPSANRVPFGQHEEQEFSISSSPP
jgi:hypothetical protein